MILAMNHIAVIANTCRPVMVMHASSPFAKIVTKWNVVRYVMRAIVMIALMAIRLATVETARKCIATNAAGAGRVAESVMVAVMHGADGANQGVG